MSVIALLILCSLAVAGGFLAAFLWAVRSGQYADRYTPSVRMLFDDAPAERNAAKDTQSTGNIDDRNSHHGDHA